MPDYTFEGPGVKVDGVTDGRPAAKAGITTGDVILSLGSIEIKGINDYMKALGQFNKGEKTTAKVKRGDQTLELEVEF
jgi:S1-C subfamily serine protease